MNTTTADRYEPVNQRDERLRQLLAACAKQDRLAFADLYESTSAKLFSVLLRILNRQDIAQDCLQEVYLKIWHKAADYKPYAASPLTWMSTIARYQAIDLLRRHRHEVLEAETNGLTERMAGEASPEELATASVEKKRLDHCLHQLKEEQRQVFALAYFKGLTHEELARQTDLPAGTIKTWIRRGLEQLRRCLEP